MSSSAALSVTQAVLARKSCRKFIPDKAVPEQVIRELLDLARRAPSGGNLQPWRIHVVSGKARDDLVNKLKDTSMAGSEYEIYPSDLGEPFKSRRAKVGNDMYQLMGIGRTDTASKLKSVAKNYQFFDAPVGLFFTVELNNPPQWSDIGMFMQTFMLLAAERGIATCAQEAWANHSAAVKEYLGIPSEQILFAGISVGYEDVTAPVNKLKTERAAVEEFVHFHKEAKL